MFWTPPFRSAGRGQAQAIRDAECVGLSYTVVMLAGCVHRLPLICMQGLKPVRHRNLIRLRHRNLIRLCNNAAEVVPAPFTYNRLAAALQCSFGLLHNRRCSPPPPPSQTPFLVLFCLPCCVRTRQHKWHMQQDTWPPCHSPSCTVVCLRCCAGRGSAHCS